MFISYILLSEVDKLIKKNIIKVFIVAYILIRKMRNEKGQEMSTNSCGKESYMYIVSRLV